MRKLDFCLCENKVAVTAKLISAFVFATRIVQFLFFLNPKLQASDHLLRLYRPVCVGPGRKPRRHVFSRRGSLVSSWWSTEFYMCYYIVTNLSWFLVSMCAHNIFDIYIMGYTGPSTIYYLSQLLYESRCLLLRPVVVKTICILIQP